MGLALALLSGCKTNTSQTDDKNNMISMAEEADAAENDSLNVVYNAYADYLSKNSLYESFEPGEYETDETKLAFSLVYIDEDEIPELIIGWTKQLANTSDICILKYVDGNVISSGPIGHYNSIGYIPRKNVLEESNFNLGICSYWYGYLDEAGELSTYCESYEECPEGESLGFTYYIKGDEVTESEYKNYYDSVINGDFAYWSGYKTSNITYILNEESLELLRSGKVEVDDASVESTHPEIAAYNDLLEEMIQENIEPLRVALLLIDNDATYELAVFQGASHSEGALLYSYQENKVIPLAIDGFPQYGSYGWFELFPNQGVISYSYDRNFGAGEYLFFLSFANGKMTLDKELRLDLIYTAEGELKDRKYYLNNEEITEEEYDSIIEGYEGSLSKTISYDSCYEVLEVDDISRALSQEYNVTD